MQKGGKKISRQEKKHKKKTENKSERCTKTQRGRVLEGCIIPIVFCCCFCLQGSRILTRLELSQLTQQPLQRCVLLYCSNNTIYSTYVKSTSLKRVSDSR